ncbi:hemerythrin domain-containing protein [Virgibacillus alimentarius]|uniref:hemerythrin domain-containing protein n=1 Tax=Virgibacillus alimentarius TaxID=698769 RepID=UPI000493283F|nr:MULTISPECIES: hemerythrin domain-containing protein [Virgibacillus]HLR67469.1 hemerythrin domain-containing protein [Virgibacillus sp.]
MSGPALKHVDSHSAIHEAALNEATELTELLDKLVRDNQKEKALELAFVIVEHWETRTLRHAESEEEGLYEDLVETSPELKDSIIALTRDHDLLKLLIQEIKELLRNGISDDVVQRFQALILVDLLHNQKEETILPDH